MQYLRGEGGSPILGKKRLRYSLPNRKLSREGKGSWKLLTQREGGHSASKQKT